MAVISINYDGCEYDYNPETNENIKSMFPIEYKNVEISLSNGDKKTFNSDNFIVDWYYAIKTFYKELYHVEHHLSYSSSVNHFIMDGAPYSSAYIHFINDKPILKYLSDFNNELEKRKIYEKGIEVFVIKNTKPTYVDYIEYIKNNEKK